MERIKGKTWKEYEKVMSTRGRGGREGHRKKVDRT